MFLSPLLTALPLALLDADDDESLAPEVDCAPLSLLVPDADEPDEVAPDDPDEPDVAGVSAVPLAPGMVEDVSP